MLAGKKKNIFNFLRSLSVVCKTITEPYLLKALEVGNILHIGSVLQRLLYVIDLFVENPILVLCI